MNANYHIVSNQLVITGIPRNLTWEQVEKTFAPWQGLFPGISKFRVDIAGNKADPSMLIFDAVPTRLDAIRIVGVIRVGLNNRKSIQLTVVGNEDRMQAFKNHFSDNTGAS